MRIATLLAPGRHPASGRVRPARCEAQAIALARRLGAVVFGLHAGPDTEVTRDYFGHGLAAATALTIPEGADPVPALAAALQADAPDIVLAGRRSEGGDGTGMVPYALAAALGWPIVPDAVALEVVERDGERLLQVEQALPRGQRRLVTVALPAVVTVHPAAPPPQPFAFAALRRGHLDARPGVIVKAPATELNEKPYRPKPRLVAGGKTSGSAAERLAAATQAASGGGTLLVDPDPDQAAEEILAFLKRIGVRDR